MATHKNYLKFFALCFFICFYILGCSSKPGEDDIKKALQEVLTNKKNNNIIIAPPAPPERYSSVKGPLSHVYEVLTCEKTNGQIREVFGVKQYSLEFKAKFKLKKNIYTHDTFYAKAYKITAQDERHYDLIPSETIIPFYGKVIFELTENGWRETQVILKTDYKTRRGYTPPSISSRGYSIDSSARGVVLGVPLKGDKMA